MALRNEKLYFEGYKQALKDFGIWDDHLECVVFDGQFFDENIERKHKKFYPDCCGQECHSCPGCCGIGDPGPLD